MANNSVMEIQNLVVDHESGPVKSNPVTKIDQTGILKYLGHIPNQKNFESSKFQTLYNNICDISQLQVIPSFGTVR